MNEAEVLEFKAGNFELHCENVEFTQCSVESPLRIVGSARVYQDDDGTLLLTQYPHEIPRMPSLGLPHGGTVPDNRHWDLGWVDCQGRVWKSERVYLPLEDMVPHWRPIEQDLQGLRRVDSHTQTEKGARFKGYLFRPLSIYANAKTERTMTRPGEYSEGSTLNVMKFQAGELEVYIRKEADYTVVVVESDTDLPDNFEQRLLEALRFLFGRPLAWSATVLTTRTQETTFLRGRPLTDRSTHFGEPMPSNVSNAWKPMSEMLGRYLLHVLKDPSSGWHPLSIWWSEVLRAGSREMESLVLTAAIAVEGVANAIIRADDIPPGVQPVSEAQAVDWRQQTAKALEELGCPKRIKQRVDGLFPKMHRIGAGDVLWALQGAGAVDKDLVQLWRDARPDAAHGEGGRWASAEQITRDADGLVTLLRQLTFWWIKYEGPFIALEGGRRHLRKYPSDCRVPAGET